MEDKIIINDKTEWFKNELRLAELHEEFMDKFTFDCKDNKGNEWNAWKDSDSPQKVWDWVGLHIKAIPVELPVMQKTADGLLPCPFCGGEASTGTTRISDPMTAKLNNRTNGFFINCKICGANNNFLHLGYATEEIAKHYWNTRK
jgi:hypothetical protein